MHRSFRCAIALVACTAHAQLPEAGEPLSAAHTDALLESLQLDVDVRLADLVEAWTGHEVLPWEDQFRAELQAAVEATLRQLHAHPLDAPRANEAGLRVEDVLLEHLEAAGFTAGVPQTQSGITRHVGYPDLVARRDGLTFYLEVKVYSAHTAHSTQRSFYLSPSTDPKVIEPAHHLLVGFLVERLPSAVPGHKRFRTLEAKLLDLSELRCGIKYEFNASNRDLYREPLLQWHMSTEPTEPSTRD